MPHARQPSRRLRGRRASTAASGGRDAKITGELRRYIIAESVASLAFSVIPLLLHALPAAGDERRRPARNPARNPHVSTVPPTKARHDLDLVFASWIACDNAPDDVSPLCQLRRSKAGADTFLGWCRVLSADPWLSMETRRSPGAWKEENSLGARRVRGGEETR